LESQDAGPPGSRQGRFRSQYQRSAARPPKTITKPISKRTGLSWRIGWPGGISAGCRPPLRRGWPPPPVAPRGPEADQQAERPDLADRRGSTTDTTRLGDSLTGTSSHYRSGSSDFKVGCTRILDAQERQAKLASLSSGWKKPCLLRACPA